MGSGELQALAGGGYEVSTSPDSQGTLAPALALGPALVPAPALGPDLGHAPCMLVYKLVLDSSDVTHTHSTDALEQVTDIDNPGTSVQPSQSNEDVHSAS